jgi:NitT/TauT family transport system substrate-binding protein
MVALAACGDETPDTAGDGSERITLRLAHFPNLTHAPAIYGLEKGIFADALGENVEIDAKTFNAGPDVITGVFSDDIDLGYIGPNPAINGFQQSDGQAVRIIAGATSGGASLVVRPEITTPDQLKGKTLSTPSLGNTQDVALRSWLASRGIDTTKEGGGDVSIKPQENAQILQAFVGRQIDGAWVPEPWASRLVLEGGGKVLLDEDTLWPDGKYATTLVIVRKKFLDENPGVVENFLKGHVRAIEDIAKDESESQRVVNEGIRKVSGKALADNVLASAWKNLDFTYDPLIATIEESAVAAENVELLDDSDIHGIEDLTLLNRVLDDEGKEQIDT